MLVERNIEKVDFINYFFSQCCQMVGLKFPQSLKWRLKQVVYSPFSVLQNCIKIIIVFLIAKFSWKNIKFKYFVFKLYTG